MVTDLGASWSASWGRMINLAIESAHKSTTTPRHGAVLFTNRRKIITCACNGPGTRTCGYDVPSVHAEAHCLQNARFRRKVRGSSLLVVRINSSAELMNSEPCDMCLFLIKRFGIARIYFSNEDGHLCYRRATATGQAEPRHLSHGLILMIQKYPDIIRARRLPLNPQCKTVLSRQAVL